MNILNVIIPTEDELITLPVKHHFQFSNDHGDPFAYA